MDVANESYFLLENNIRKMNEIIENFEQELTNAKFNDFSYQNSFVNKNLEELLNFDNFLKCIIYFIN